jgi:hypothetical protein
VTSRDNHSYVRSWLTRHDIQLQDLAHATERREKDVTKSAVDLLLRELTTAATREDAIAAFKPRVVSLWQDVYPISRLRLLLVERAGRVERALRERYGLAIGCSVAVDNALLRLVQRTRESLANIDVEAWLDEALLLEIETLARDHWDSPPVDQDRRKAWARLILEGLVDATSTRHGRAPAGKQPQGTRLPQGEPTVGRVVEYLQQFVLEICPQVERYLLPHYGKVSSESLQTILHTIAGHAMDEVTNDSEVDIELSAKRKLFSFLLARRAKVRSKKVTQYREVGTMGVAEAICLWLGWKERPRKPQAKSATDKGDSSAPTAPLRLGTLWEELDCPSDLLPNVVGAILAPKRSQGWTEDYLMASAMVRVLADNPAMALVENMCQAQRRLANVLQSWDGEHLSWSDLDGTGIPEVSGRPAATALKMLHNEAASMRVTQRIAWIVAVCVNRHSSAEARAASVDAIDSTLSQERRRLADYVNGRLVNAIRDIP